MEIILRLLGRRSLDSILAVFTKMVEELQKFLDHVERENTALQTRVEENKKTIEKARKALSNVEKIVA